MATVMRLSRMGTIKKPFFRIVVADSRKKKEGRIIEMVGYFQQIKNPPIVKINDEKAILWLKKGAVPSETVKNIFKKSGLWKIFLESKKA